MHLIGSHQTRILLARCGRQYGLLCRSLKKRPSAHSNGPRPRLGGCTASGLHSARPQTEIAALDPRKSPYSLGSCACLAPPPAKAGREPVYSPHKRPGAASSPGQCRTWLRVLCLPRSLTSPEPRQSQTSPSGYGTEFPELRMLAIKTDKTRTGDEPGAAGRNSNAPK